jgi:hypothetical protein
MIEKKLKKIISLEIEVDISSVSNDKIFIKLCEESLIGTPEEDIISENFLTPSVCRAISIILEIEEKFNIIIKDEEANDILENEGKIIDLIKLIEHKKFKINK